MNEGSNQISQPSKDERIAFWQHAYARASFLRSKAYIALLLRENPGFNTELRTSLTVAILVTYCRPFKQRRLVKLSEDVVPAAYRETHDLTIEMRDKVIAHRDLDGPVADWGFLSQLRVEVQGSEALIHTLSPSIEDSRARQLSQLIAVLVPIMEQRIQPFLRCYLNPPPADGSYIVSLDETPADWLQRASIE